MSEPIPNDSWLYRRIHWSLINPDTGEVSRSAFALRKGELGLSVDWDRYSTPEDARQRAKVPEDNAIGALLAGGVRQLPGHDVHHNPKPDNPAHSLIIGDNSPRARFHLARHLCNVVLPISPERLQILKGL